MGVMVYGALLGLALFGCDGVRRVVWGYLDCEHPPAGCTFLGGVSGRKPKFPMTVCRHLPHD
jgi:hypothetical protein